MKNVPYKEIACYIGTIPLIGDNDYKVECHNCFNKYSKKEIIEDGEHRTKIGSPFFQK